MRKGLGGLSGFLGGFGVFFGWVLGGCQPHAAPPGTCSKSKVTTPSWSTSIAWKNPAARGKGVVFLFFFGVFFLVGKMGQVKVESWENPAGFKGKKLGKKRSRV